MPGSALPHDIQQVSREFLDRLTGTDTVVPAGSAAAMSGAMAASIAVSICDEGLERTRSPRVAADLRDIRRKAMSMKRDLLALIDRDATASLAIAGMRPPEPDEPDARRIRALLFAAEVPLRTAQTCAVLMALTLSALTRVGLKCVAPAGTAAALAYSGAIGGVLAARSQLAAIPEGSGTGAGAARKRAEICLREAEALRTQVIDRVRQHLP